MLLGYAHFLNSLRGIFRDNSLGPRALLVICCATHSGLLPPAYPAKAKDPRKSICKGSTAPSLLRASIAGDI